MAKPRFDLDRSAAFTVLLDVLPGYAESVDDGGRTVTEFLAAWYDDASTDMHEFARRWAVAKRATL